MIEDMLTGKGLQAIEQQVSQKTVNFFFVWSLPRTHAQAMRLCTGNTGVQSLTFRRRRANGVKGPNLTRTEVSIKDAHSGRKQNGH